MLRARPNSINTTKEEKEWYKRWQEHYSFKDSHNEMVLQAINAKGRGVMIKANRVFIAYVCVHLGFRGYVRFMFGGIGNVHHSPTQAWRKAYTGFRFGKYFALLGLVGARAYCMN